MNQQFGLSQYLHRIEENSYSNQLILSQSPQQLLNFKSPYFSKSFYENQPHLDSCPLSKEKMDECTQQKEVENAKLSEAEVNVEKKIFFSKLREEDFKKSFRGSRNDTMELNINFKTLLVGHFRQLIYLKQLSLQQQLSVESFAKQTPSFRALKAFFEQREGNQGIRSKCREFLASSGCIKKILRGRCKLMNKAMMIKFIEKLRLNLYNKDCISKWKEYSKDELSPKK